MQTGGRNYDVEKDENQVPASPMEKIAKLRGEHMTAIQFYHVKKIQ